MQVICNCSNSSKNNPEKNLLIYSSENEFIRKVWVAALNQKGDTPVQSQHTDVKSTLGGDYYNVIMLLCTAKTQWVENMMGTQARTDLMPVVL